ncbi:MAG: hypothetical protein ACRCYT_00250, partial [Cetobacterium sp.]
GIEVNIDNLPNVNVNLENTTNDSLFLNNYIEKKYGSAKIYKAKKRLELRLRPKKWVEDGLCIELSIPQSLKAVNLREVDLKSYKKSLFK